MSEEAIQKEVQEALEQESVEVIEPEESAEGYTDAEVEAMEHGWNPEGVDGKKNLSAEEFMDRKPLYDDIHGLKKTVRKLQDGIDAMKQMHDGIRVREREKVIKELQGAKKQALEDENYDAVVQIDDQIAQERADARAPEIDNGAFEQWVDKNDWYHQDSEMKAYADTIGTGYQQQNPTVSLDRIYDYVEKEVKARFPSKFGNPNREKPTPVEGASKGRTRRTALKHSVSDLPDQDRRIMDTILRADPKMTKDEYLKQYYGE